MRRYILRKANKLYRTGRNDEYLEWTDLVFAASLTSGVVCGVMTGKEYIKKDKFPSPLRSPIELAVVSGAGFLIGALGLAYFKYHLPFTAYGVYIYYTNKIKDAK